VAVRDVVEEVSDAADTRFGGRLGQLGADPVEGLDRGVENARAGPVNRGLAEVGAARLALAGEAAQRYWAASSHHQLGCPPSCFSTSTPSGTWVSTSSSGIGAPAPAITVTISASSAR
jgi:hypothetical protein